MSNNNNKIQFIFCLLCAIFLIQIFSMFPNQNVKQNEFGKGVSLNNSGSNISPKTADSPISFINSFVNFTVQPKGYMLGTGSITYDNVSQNMDWLPYLMINTGNVSAFSSFTELQSFQNLTNISPNTNEIAEGIIQYPYANVNVTYIIELYPNSRFFVVVFYVNSPTLNNYLANLFLYNDLLIDGSSYNEYAKYIASNQSIYAYDNSNSRSLGWCSPDSVKDWDIGTPSTIQSEIPTTNFNEINSTIHQESALLTEYGNTSIQTGYAWAVPIIYGFGETQSQMELNSVTLAHQFDNNWAVLSWNFTGGIFPSIQAEYFEHRYKYSEPHNFYFKKWDYNRVTINYLTCWTEWLPKFSKLEYDIWKL